MKPGPTTARKSSIFFHDRDSILFGFTGAFDGYLESAKTKKIKSIITGVFGYEQSGQNKNLGLLAQQVNLVVRGNHSLETLLIIDNRQRIEVVLVHQFGNLVLLVSFV